MERIATGLSELIGRTPLMELQGYERAVGAPARIVAKLECFNPAGSAKDRIGLAMIEDADKTALFIENMAEFFRYNLSRINEDATLADEIQLVDHYIYILNVRFAGDIHYKKEIEPGLENVLVPSMILQPLVENAVQYGIRGVEWEGWVTLRIWQEAGTVYIEVADNGRGMSRELIERVLQGENVKNRKNSKSNGIGIYNVLERLQMYYTTEDVLEIKSDGEGKGTQFMLKIPKEVRP